MISRRHFVATTAAVPLAAAPAMPTRTLGKTGAVVSCLAFGGGSRFLMYKSEDEAAQVLHRAMELGITYFDNAFGYGNGASEERYGRILKPYRKKLFLVTKTGDRTYDGAMRSVEGSLKRMQLDQLDLVHAHSLTDANDLAALESGALKALYKLREQKVTRFIGVSSHTDPATLKTALERNDFDVTQMALNAARVGQAGVREGTFENTALPVANSKKMGVIAMKVFAQDRLQGRYSTEELVHYSLSLPVTAVVIGMPKPQHLEANAAAVKAFRPLDPAERDRLFEKFATQKASIDRYFANHQDA